MAGIPGIQHTYLLFGARHNLTYATSKRFSDDIELRKVSKRYLRRLVARIYPEGANSYRLTDTKSKFLECLYLRESSPRAVESKPSFFDTHLSEQHSAIPDALAACVAAIDIAQPLFFSSDFMVGYWTTRDGIRLHQYAGQDFRTSTSMWTAVYEPQSNFLSEDVWARAKEIYSGIQSISRDSHPRLHQAIRFHARAVREDFFDYCYLNEFLVLESLFNTSPQEIAHKMAERAAIVAGNPDPSATYKTIKEVAAFRNQIAHGFKKSKSSKAEASAMLKRLGAENRRLLESILTNEKLRETWKTSKDEELESHLLALTLK